MQPQPMRWEQKRSHWRTRPVSKARIFKLQSWIVSLLRDLQTKVRAQDLYSEARDLIFTTPSGQPISAVVSPSISDQYSTLRVCHD